MPVKFTVHPDDGYYLAKFVGKISDSEMLNDFRRFFSGDKWIPGLNELADISEADVTGITADGVNKLAMLIENIFQQYGISPKVAVYAPHDLPYGLARMYSVSAEKFETHDVFRDLDEAKAWLFK